MPSPQLTQRVGKQSLTRRVAMDRPVQALRYLGEVLTITAGLWHVSGITAAAGSWLPGSGPKALDSRPWPLLPGSPAADAGQ